MGMPRRLSAWLRWSVGITVSYWQSEAAILAWRQNPEHQVIQARGRLEWYSAFHTRVCKVEREYRFGP
jgi:heme-degrading monooxygenase HmoA